MKTNELRLGNLIIEDGKQTEFNGDFYHWCDDIMKPITLNEDWLIDFGFYQVELDNGEKYYQNYRFRLNCNYNGFYYSRNLDVKYVHQLQNLYFALIGVELELSSNVA
jgi:hypothetical protein